MGKHFPLFKVKSILIKTIFFTVAFRGSGGEAQDVKKYGLLKERVIKLHERNLFIFYFRRVTV